MLLLLQLVLMEVGFIEVFPPRASGSRQPVLLQTLETQLLEASNAASRLASAGPHQQRDPKLAANLSLDVHRQVFQTFADGFGEAYKPLLTEIQQAFDASIQQGLQDSQENTTLRQQLLQAASEQAAAEDAATAEVISGREQQRQDLYDQIAAAQVQLDAAQRRRDLARRDLARAKAELERLRGSTKASKVAKQRLSDAATAEANWLAARPQAAALLAMAAGPLTDQEDEELEAELGVSLDSSTPQHPLERALQLLEKHDATSAAKLLEHHMGAGTSRRRQLSSVASPGVTAGSQQGVQPQQPSMSTPSQEDEQHEQQPIPT